MSKKTLIYLSFFLTLLILALYFLFSRKIFRSALISEETKPNIVFMLVDALRKDHLGCYGYARKTTPFIDELAKNGLLFENAIAQAPWTSSSVASIFTGKYPSQIGVGAIEDSSGMRNLDHSLPSVLRKKTLTLAEVLKKAGYKTHAIGTNPYIVDKFRMLQGYRKKTYRHNAQANEIMDIAIDTIAKHTAGSQSPFFVYLHLMDLHTPVDPPPPFDTFFPTLDSAPHKMEHKEWEIFNEQEIDSEKFKIYKSHKLALYDGSLNYLDFQIGRFVSYLKEAGLTDNTIIVIASDHGEEFWDHAHFEMNNFHDPRNIYGIGHGHTVFKELLDVPLIIFGNDIPLGKVKQQVRNIDIAPTLLGLAGLSSADDNMEGIDLIGKLKHNELKDMIAFSEDIAYGYEQKSLQNRDHKYIRYQNRELLFDKTNDPNEMIDISGDKPVILQQFREFLDDMLKQFEHKERVTVKLDEETKKRLRSLGYLK
jgi:arylsulfatase A-like enzyme